MIKKTESNEAALVRCLQPLTEILARPDVQSVSVTQPNQVCLWNREGSNANVTTDSLGYGEITEMIGEFAKYTQKGYSKKSPVITGHLPDGRKMQVTLPPAVKPGHFAISINKTE